MISSTMSRGRWTEAPANNVFTSSVRLQPIPVVTDRGRIHDAHALIRRLLPFSVIEETRPASEQQGNDVEVHLVEESRPYGGLRWVSARHPFVFWAINATEGCARSAAITDSDSSAENP